MPKDRFGLKKRLHGAEKLAAEALPKVLEKIAADIDRSAAQKYAPSHR